MSLAPLNLRRRDFLIAVVLIILAFGLRTVVLVDRSQRDPLFLPLPVGSDQLTYVTKAQQYDAGLFPTAPFRYQPGFIYFLVGLRHFVGTNLIVDRFGLILLNSLACGLMIGVGWLLTRRRWGGFLTGLIYACYPVAMFYSTEFLLEGTALFYVCLFLFLALWQRERRSWLRSLVTGLTLGVMIITRTNLALLLFAWLLWLFLIEPDRRRALTHGLVSLVALALVIAPVTLWNFKLGSHQLITNVGADEIYRANSRDSDGTYLTPYNAHNTVINSDYIQALIDDVKRDPFRFVAIQVRKVGLYWSDAEPANNIDYYQNGEDVSPLLRAIPLDFRILAALGLLGTFVLWLSDRKAGLFFAAAHLMIFAGIMVIWVISRVRLPAVAPLVATSGFLLVWLGDQISARKWTRLARQAVPAALVTAAFLIFCGWAIDHALVKHPLSQLPADAHPDDIVFDQRLKLAGWRWFDEWPSAEQGWAKPMQHYGVELFWELVAPADQDYSAYVAYIQDGVRYAANDAAIGTITRPPVPTSHWKPGEIYSEIMGFEFPSGIPSARTGAIHVGVYIAQGEIGSPDRKAIGVPITSDPAAKSDLILESMAVFDPGQPPRPLTDLTAATLNFGSQIALQGYHLPDANAPGATANFEFQWQALTDLSTDYTLFIHVMDADNQLQASYNAPVGGALLSSNWMPGYPVSETIPITLPTTPGKYQVYIGLYHPDTKDRLPIDAPDDRPLLGAITIGG